MIQEQAAAAVIIALVSDKNKPRKNRKKSLCETSYKLYHTNRLM